ncbi:MAG: TetR/AcrR family transcriptional regulator, partial [Solirubrobacteraceae bacterium]
MLAAALEAVEEVGYARMTVAQVIGRAKVSRKTFYDVFADREDCFLAALEGAAGQVGALVREAYDGELAWRDGVRAGLTELLMFLDEEPALARLFLVEALGAGPRVLERRAQLLEELAEVVDRGRFVTNAVREPPQVAAEGVVGAVFAVLHTRALEDGGERFAALLGSLMNIVVLPYLGARVAGRELARSAPEPRRAEDDAPTHAQ